MLQRCTSSKSPYTSHFHTFFFSLVDKQWNINNNIKNTLWKKAKREKLNKQFIKSINFKKAWMTPANRIMSNAGFAWAPFFSEAPCPAMYVYKCRDRLLIDFNPASNNPTIRHSSHRRHTHTYDIHLLRVQLFNGYAWETFAAQWCCELIAVPFIFCARSFEHFLHAVSTCIVRPLLSFLLLHELNNAATLPFILLHVRIIVNALVSDANYFTVWQRLAVITNTKAPNCTKIITCT